ncbi:hypothetical protein D1159_03850 [Pseudoflavonifractor sp. 524-17]|uniref:hypothetical protein n=1 Tax=Pseudoflavonifractor sp. 524-17 TaxID=2304577 RepID=UPI00137AE27C|nr:hypothetical protein [Pseudoflavonifractor sp. 524-17]NCE63733.1 hypothetical protein [Pseudoflavonifractor sp. 524-17]
MVKRKILALILAGLMAVSLAGCVEGERNADSTPPPTQEVAITPTPKPEPSKEPKFVGTPLFEDVYITYAERKQSLAFDDVKAFVEELDYETEITEPTTDDLGQIKVFDLGKEGDYVFITFLPNEANYEIIYLISYYQAETNCEVSMANYSTNRFEAYDEFKTHIIGETEITVSGIDEQREFLFSPDSKKPKVTESAEGPQEMISVGFSVNVEGSTGKPEFHIETNLPDETVLMLTLDRDDSRAQTKVIVKNGEATSEAFSDKGAPLSGDYLLTVSMGLPRLQSDYVRSIIGENGEYIEGPYVETDSITGENVVSATFDFEF